MDIACYIRNDALFSQVKGILARAGFESTHFVSETALLRACRHRNFDLILIDMGENTAESDGIVSWLNCRSGNNTPVIVLSTVRSANLVAFSLDAGADDCIGGHFEPIELIARVHALLRRCNRKSVRRVIELNGFILDREANSFSYQGTPIELTPREFTMAWLFFSTPGIYISRETIGTAIWGVDSEIAGRTIEQHVYKLRKKLQLGPQRGILIRTAYSQGYRLELSI
jgi:DNA-binding response OmpR family regulator